MLLALETKGKMNWVTDVKNKLFEFYRISQNGLLLTFAVVLITLQINTNVLLTRFRFGISDVTVHKLRSCK